MTEMKQEMVAGLPTVMYLITGMRIIRDYIGMPVKNNIYMQQVNVSECGGYTVIHPNI